MPVSVRHVDKDSGLIATSLLHMPNINCGSIARQMYDECRKVREGFSLDWDNCVTYSSDNTNSMTGQRNNLLEKMQSDQKVTKRFLMLVALVV